MHNSFSSSLKMSQPENLHKRLFKPKQNNGKYYNFFATTDCFRREVEWSKITIKEIKVLFKFAQLQKDIKK